MSPSRNRYRVGLCLRCVSGGGLFFPETRLKLCAFLGFNTVRQDGEEGLVLYWGA